MSNIQDVTSAGQKASFAYEKLIELLVMSAVKPGSAFVWGCDYRIPMMHGLLEADYVDQIRMSATYRETVFAQEYLSLWGGGSEDSWFNYERTMRHRRLKNPEVQAQKNPRNRDTFYLIGVDVARQRAQSVFTVARVSPRRDRFINNIVNIYATEGQPFDVQAGMLKHLISLFGPREVVIDATGIGQGLLDAMAKETFYNGKVYPAYGTHNVEEWQLPPNLKHNNILYALVATASLNSEIHANCYTLMDRGQVRFLITEQEAKSSLLETKVGQNMSANERILRIGPHERTTMLFEEMANLRAVPTNDGKVKLEPIIKRMTKDKFSSFEYLLYRSKALEGEFYKNKYRSGEIYLKTLAFSGTKKNKNRGGVGRWGRKQR